MLGSAQLFLSILQARTARLPSLFGNALARETPFREAARYFKIRDFNLRVSRCDIEANN